ncbi:MAG: carboxymuconolactone decarboxylase family protein [Actinomycetota bacterium]
MSRLPALTYDDTTDEQREVWDWVIETRGGRGLPDMTDATGSLRGPFHAMTARPHLGRHMLELGRAVRFESSLEPRLLEIAICAVGVHWRSEFEFWAHRRLALAAGVDEAVLDAMASGEVPDFGSEDEAAVFAFASSLLKTGRVNDADYQQAHGLLGDDALIDLTITIGYYCQISLVLNAFAVGLPDGVEPRWP